MGHPLREKNDMDRRLGVNQQDQKIKLILGTMVAVACLMILLRQGGHASLTQRPGTERGLGRRLGAPEGAIGCQISTKYYPSTMEQAWLDNVGTWQSDFCGIISGEQQTAWAKTWLETLQKKQEDSKYRPELDPAVFSRFVTSSNCAGKTEETVTWIEPLAHGLRHPNALCSKGADIMDMSYLLISENADVLRLREASFGNKSDMCGDRRCHNIYIDLGGTTWDANDKVPGQGWFVRQYQQRGIDMDRMLLWEAAPVTPPSKVYDQLPKELLHKYQYFNIPAITDITQASHPVRMLKQIARPGDFVALKLDIDHSGAETSILQALLADSEAAALVDEFYFEYHVNFTPMLPWWGASVDKEKGLAEAFKLFYELRQRGWRAHSWV